MLFDYHVHSTCSGDGHVSMEDMCARAVEIGIGEIAFTEHLDNNPADLCYGTFDYSFYIAQIESARRKFDSLRILTGVEFGEPHTYPEQIQAIREWELDVVLAVVHWVGDKIIAVDEFGDSDVGEMYDLYLDEVLKTAQVGGFDVLGHFDLVKRFGVKYAGPFRFESFRDRIAAILEAMIERGIALEVNTSGLRQPCRETFPGLRTLKLYRELGGELVTIGSDAHRIEQLGFGLEEGLSLIRAAGFDKIAVYRSNAGARRPRCALQDMRGEGVWEDGSMGVWERE